MHGWVIGMEFVTLGYAAAEFPPHVPPPPPLRAHCYTASVVVREWGPTETIDVRHRRAPTPVAVFVPTSPRIALLFPGSHLLVPSLCPPITSSHPPDAP